MSLRELTRRAEGTKVKGGSQRRIVVTMDEGLFFELRARAIDDDRSLSALIVRYLKSSLTTGNGAK